MFFQKKSFYIFPYELRMLTCCEGAKLVEAGRTGTSKNICVREQAPTSRKDAVYESDD